MRRGPLTSLLVVVALAVGALAYTVVAGNSPQLGLDLQGGASVVLRPKTKVSSGALGQAISIIRNRVDGLGVAEADVHAEGQNIVVQLPGVKDQKRALALVGQTAELRFRPVLQAVPISETPTTAKPTSTTTTKPGATTTTAAGTATTATAGAGKATTTTATTATAGAGKATTVTTATAGAGKATTTAAPATLRAAAGTAVAQGASTTTTAAPAPTTTAAVTTIPAAAPSTPAPAATGSTCVPTAPDGTATPIVGKDGKILATRPEDDKPERTVVLPLTEKGNVTGYSLGPCQLSGNAIKSATATFNSTGGAWTVDFTLTGKGSTDFDALAARNLQKRVAIVLDGVVKSAPTIQTAQFNGRGQISGSFSEKEAKDLALVLRYGSLPVELKRETVQTVSASLGKDSLHAGVLAGLLGLGLVLFYMVLYYRALGVVVVLGLSVSGMLMWSIVSFLGAHSGLALSLAGAVGIIVSVGVTVDSYVVYFERLKDEIRAGKTIRSSVDRGFARAYRTILAADTASLIGATLLYVLTVGSVRGFAFFLGLSTVLDMLIAYVFTRPLVILLGRNRLFTEARWLGVARGLAAPAPSGGAS